MGDGRDAERRNAEDGIHVEGDRLHVADRSCHVDPSDSDAVLGGYVGLLTELRHTRPGEPLQLRADDLEALAAALGADSSDIERRIVAIVGCTRDEADRLARELRRRRLLRPVAVAALGLAVVTGVQAERGDQAEPRVVLVEPAAAATVDREPAAPASASTTTTTTTTVDAAPDRELTDAPAPTSGEPAPSNRPAPAPPAPAPPPSPPPATDPAPPAPVASTDDGERGEPDVGIPEGEVFVEADPVTGEPLGP